MCRKWLPAVSVEPHTRCFDVAVCLVDRWCDGFRHLPDRQFTAYIVGLGWRSHSVCGKRSRFSGRSSKKRHHHGDSPLEDSFPRRFVSVESDVAAIKVTLAQLSAALFSPTSGSPFSGFQLPALPGVSGVAAPAVAASPLGRAGVGGVDRFATQLPGSAMECCFPPTTPSPRP